MLGRHGATSLAFMPGVAPSAVKLRSPNSIPTQKLDLMAFLACDPRWRNDTEWPGAVLTR
jgi:hypothetical protein